MIKQKETIKRTVKYIYFFFFVFLFNIRSVNAYIDPSVMTYAIQAIAGMAIALGTIIGIYWRRVKGLLRDKFHIDFQSDKELESDDLYYEEEQSSDRIVPKHNTNQITNKLDNQKLSFIPAILLSIAICALWLFYAPIQLYFNNIGEYRIDITKIVPVVSMYCAIFTIAIIAIYAIVYFVHKKTYTVFILLGLIFLIASFIQGNVLVFDLPRLNGSDFNWDAHPVANISSILMWILIIGLGILLYRKLNKQSFVNLSGLLSGVMLVILCVSLVMNGFITGGFEKKRPAAISKKGEFIYSTNENFILFIVDAVDAKDATKVIEKDYDYYSKMLEDFTYYTNTVSAYAFTQYAVPYILSGEWMLAENSFKVESTHALKNSPLFKTLEEKNYRMGLYGPDIVFDDEDIYKFENVVNAEYNIRIKRQFFTNNIRMTWFLYAPYPLKKYLSDTYMPFSLVNNAMSTGDVASYSNRVFYNDIRNNEFEKTEDKMFKYLHIDGAHVPFNLDKDMNSIPESEGTYEKSIEATFTMIDTYLKRLKEEGVYDNSVIIIMADHGFNNIDKDLNDVYYRDNPVLFIKGIHEKHPFVMSDIPLHQEDFQEAYQKLLVGKESDELFDWKETDVRKRRHIVFVPLQANEFIEFYQEGHAGNRETLVPSGVIYELK